MAIQETCTLDWAYTAGPPPFNTIHHLPQLFVELVSNQILPKSHFLKNALRGHWGIGKMKPTRVGCPSWMLNCEVNWSARQGLSVCLSVTVRLCVCCQPLTHYVSLLILQWLMVTSWFSVHVQEQAYQKQVERQRNIAISQQQTCRTDHQNCAAVSRSRICTQSIKEDEILTSSPICCISMRL